MLAADAAEEATWQMLRRWFGNRSPHLILLAATPGLRRAQDNGLRFVVRWLSLYWPQVPLVQISSTAVYDDLHGGLGDESAPITQQGRARDLLAIEAAVHAHSAAATILRAGGLRGGQRHQRLQAMRHGPVRVSGPLARFLPLIHEKDLADLLVGVGLHLHAGDQVPSVINAVQPDHWRARQFFLEQARLLGCQLQIELRADVQAASRRLITRYDHAHLAGPRLVR
jgi:hypothetical protein